MSRFSQLFSQVLGHLPEYRSHLVIALMLGLGGFISSRLARLVTPAAGSPELTAPKAVESSVPTSLAPGSADKSQALLVLWEADGPPASDIELYDPAGDQMRQTSDKGLCRVPAKWAEEGAMLRLFYHGRVWTRIIKLDDRGRPLPIVLGHSDGAPR